jgi:hypothetical protein
MSQPATTAHSAFGYVLKVKILGTDTEIYECYGLTLRQGALNLDDATTLGSPGAAEELIPGKKTGGELTWTMNHLPADTTHRFLETAYNNRTKEIFTMIASDTGAETSVFSGYISKYDRVAEQGIAKVECAVRITGQIVVTP